MLANIRPSGEFLMEDFYYAGGLPALLAELGDKLDRSALTVTGKTIGENIADAKVYNADVIRSLDNPVSSEVGTAILTGNLAPDGCVIKPSAAEPRLLKHSGPALVFRDYNEMAAKIDSDDLEVTADHVLVLQNAGPVGGPGMPEWGMLPIPKKLLKQGVRDMLRISDARMSGTSYGACILHVAPESYIGGPLAAVRTGDIISVDVERRSHQARGDGGRDRATAGGVVAAGPHLPARLQQALRRAYPAGRQGLRLRFPRRHSADAGAGNPLAEAGNDGRAVGRRGGHLVRALPDHLQRDPDDQNEADIGDPRVCA